MPRLLSIEVTDELKQKFRFSLLVINVIFLMAGISTVIAATHLRKILDAKEQILGRQYSHRTLPLIFYVCGTCMIIHSGFGIFIIMHENLRKVTDDESVKLNRLKKYCAFILAYMLGSVALTIYIFATSVIAFAHIVKMEEAIGKGLTLSLHQYNARMRVKRLIDDLQMTYKCCGVRNYEDWFKVPWMKGKYFAPDDDSLALVAPDYYEENAPFSCCKVSFPAECHNDLVRDNLAHFNYHYEENLAIYEIGCHQALMDYFGRILLPALGGYTFVLVVLQVVIAVISRYVHTSMTSRIKGEDVIHGWLIEWNDPPGVSRRMANTSSHDEAEERRNNETDEQGTETGETLELDSQEKRMERVVVVQQDDSRVESTPTYSRRSLQNVTETETQDTTADTEELHHKHHKKHKKPKVFSSFLPDKSRFKEQPETGTEEEKHKKKREKHEKHKKEHMEATTSSQYSSTALENTKHKTKDKLQKDHKKHRTVTGDTSPLSHSTKQTKCYTEEVPPKKPKKTKSRHKMKPEREDSILHVKHKKHHKNIKSSEDTQEESKRKRKHHKRKETDV